MEDLWFGPWKYLLLGGLLNCKHLDSVTKKLMKDLKSKCKVNVSESILRSVISGASSQQKECLSELILKKGCYIGGKQCDNDTSPGENSSSLSSLVSDFLTNAIQEIGDEDLADREPVILVPDFDIQLSMFEDMGFKVDHSSTIYKCFRLKVLDAEWMNREDVKRSLALTEYGKAQKTVASKVDQICKGVGKGQNLAADFGVESGELVPI